MDLLTHFGWSIAGPVSECLLEQQRYLPSTVGHILRVAFRHFASLERRFKKDQAFAKNYAAVVNEYITAGHAKPVDPTSSTTRGHIWYLQNHGITTATSPEKSE